MLFSSLKSVSQLQHYEHFNDCVMCHQVATTTIYFTTPHDIPSPIFLHYTWSFNAHLHAFAFSIFTLFPFDKFPELWRWCQEHCHVAFFWVCAAPWSGALHPPMLWSKGLEAERPPLEGSRGQHRPGTERTPKVRGCGRRDSGLWTTWKREIQSDLVTAPAW